jgi:PAS domain S-box-containing protein
MHATGTAQQFLETTLDALHHREDWRSILDALPVPVYTTDGAGAVTYWNQACVKFAGRRPQLGRDKWCVTWKLYSMSGDPLPHDRCPMAEAIRGQTEVRGKVAIAMRPDGSRRAFTPYPTPLFDKAGNLRGAVNLLIDVSEEQAEALSEQVARCRRLARSTTDVQASRILADMAQGYAETVQALKPAH